jgi:Protein of unknown function (DUF3592).
MQNIPLLFIGIVLLACAALFQQRRSSGQSRVFRTRGTVLSKEDLVTGTADNASNRSTARDAVTLVVVSFQAGSGEPLTFQSQLSARDAQALEPGSEVTVLYDALNPARARLAPAVPQRTATIALTLCLLVGACFFFYGLLSLMKH